MAGFRETPSSTLGTPESFGSNQVALLDEVPGALALLVAALDKAGASRADDLGLIIAGIAVARGSSYRLLLEAGTVPSLLRHLPHNASMGIALAIEMIAANENGQDALCKCNAPPLLLAAASQASNSAAARCLASSLGHLAAHASARAELASLEQRAASDDKALELYAMAGLTARGFFAMRGSVMQLLQSLSARSLSQGALLLIQAVAISGSPEQKYQLITSGSTFEMLVQSVEGDVTGWAWSALSQLVGSDQGRKRALQLELPRRLPAALKSNFKVAYQALVVIDRLSVSASKAAAAVLATDGVISELTRLIAASGEDYEARYMANAAASTIKNVVESAPVAYELTPLSEWSLAMQAASVLERAAVEALEPTLKLLSLPKVADASTDHLASLASVLARSAHGCSLARIALGNVLQTDVTVTTSGLQDAFLLRNRLLSACYDNGLWEPARDLGVELMAVLELGQREPERCSAALIVLHSLPDFESSVAPALMSKGSAVHVLVGLLDPTSLDIAHFALRALCVVAKLPGGYTALADAGALQAAVQLLRERMSSSWNCADLLSAILSAADSAGGDERRRVADAVVALGAVPMLQAQVMNDPLLRRSTTADCCTLLTHLARTDAGARTLKALIDARAVCAVRKVVATTSHARAAAMGTGGLMTAVRSWLTALDSMAPAEREATLGLVSDLGAARDVSTETHVLPLVPLIVPVLQSVLDGGASARDASAVAAVKLLAALSAEQAGLRAVHGAGVLPLLLPLMRAGSAAGEGAYLSEGGTLLKRALVDAEARPAGVRVVEAVVGMLPAAEGVSFDPFDAAEARFASELLITPSNEASATTETQIVWPRDSVRLQYEAPPGSRTRWRAWAQGDVGTVLRSAGRGDWTVQLESDAGTREVHVPGHELRLLHERAFAAGDVVIATRSLQHATEEGSAGGRAPRPSALLLLRRAPDDDTRRGANWHAYQWHPGALTVVNEGDVARAPWQAHSRQSGGTPQPTEAREALVAIAQRVYAQLGEWEGETVSATRSAAAREGHHIDAAEANRAIQEAKRRWQGGRSCMRMATLNHGGILVRLRETTAAIPGQRRMATAPGCADAAALAWEADGRLWRTMHTLAAGNDVVLLQETHLPEHDPEGLSARVIQLLTSGEFSTWRVAASPAPKDDTYAGVLMWWNTATVEVTETLTLMPGRLQRARVRVLADGTDLIVVNAYLPTKHGTPTVRQAAALEQARGHLQTALDAADDAGDEIAIGGDLQAQTAATLEARKDKGSGHEYDSWLDTMCTENCLLSVGDDEPTYSGGVDGPRTTIDHWLVSTGLADRSAAEVGAGADGLAGLEDGAHGHHSLQLSITLRTAEAEDIEEEWEQREPQLPPMDEDEWAAFEAQEGETAATAEDGVAGAGAPTFGHAARRLVAIEEALKGLVTRIQGLSDRSSAPQGTKIARLHANMLRWRRWLRVCDGNGKFPDTHAMFNTEDCAQVLGDAPNTDDGLRKAILGSALGGARRIALREVCRTRFLHARERYEGAVAEGAIDKDRIRTRLLADIQKAIEEGRDPRWECFRAVGRAKAALAGKRTAPRLDQPGMRAIKRTGSTVAETGTGPVLRAIHDESVVMHQERGASAAGALNIQDRMAAAGLPAPWPHTVHERRDDEEVTAGDARHAAEEARRQEAWTQWRKNTNGEGSNERDPWEAVRSIHYTPLVGHLRAEMQTLMTDASIDRGLQRFRARQGVGVGGFSGIWIARASAPTRLRYAQALRDTAADVIVAADALERAGSPQDRRVAIEMIRDAAPQGWTQWIIMLLTKPGKALDVLSKRRDICLQPHSLKLCANAVAPHYAKVQEHVQPESNSGFRERGAATAAALWLGLTKEEAASERKGWYCGYIDKGGFFQSCVRRAQRVVEARFGVPVTVTTLIMAIHEALTVRYDSGAGITHGTESNVGNGQGDTIAPMRSMIPLAIETRAVEWLVAGFQFVSPVGVQRTRTPQGWFADDGAFVVDSLHALQQAFTVASAMARVLGFTVGIDVDAKGIPTGDKTGWMGSEWRKGVWTEVSDDVTIRLVDGRVVPRVQGFYKHLGIRQTPIADWATARQVVSNRCGGIASALSRLGILTAEEYVDTIDAATTTVVAYYGAAFPVGEKACERIDAAKRRGLARMGHAGERTSRWLAHAPRPQGLGMAMTWPHAAAALVVEVDRALNMPETAPAHVAIASRIAKEFWRWGWRPNNAARVPLAWNPTWIRDTLTEEGIVEAWQLYLQTAKVRTCTSDGGSGAVDALADRYRKPDDPGGADAPVWEREGRTYGRRLARLGGVLRKHYLAEDGGWRTIADLGEHLGRGGRIVGGRRVGARLTPAEAREYRTLLQQFHPDENEWARTHPHSRRERPPEVRAVGVLGAGPGATGGTDFLLEFSDGTTRWGRRPRALAPGIPAQLHAAHEAYLASGAHTVEQHAADLLDDSPGALWLATTAPLAVGARHPRDILADAHKELGSKVQVLAEFIVLVAQVEPGTPLAQGLRSAATKAHALAELASHAASPEQASPHARAALEERAETAWAWAAATDAAATNMETPKTDKTERAATLHVAERAYAEWIAAKAREATGIYAEALATWGQALPEHGLASVGNAEGAHAAAEADARSPAIRFRPSARPECFLGTLMPAGEDGRRHMRPSLELTEAQRDATATLPSTVPIPTENDIQRDPRVAWDDAWRMWNPTPRRLGWKLTAEQHAQVQRQRLAAVARRAATHTAHPRPTGATITGAQAEETAPTAEEASSRSHGINRARQQLAEALAAEDRADAAACDDWWPSAWNAEELAAAEQEAEGTRGGVDAEPWDDMDDVETYDDAGVTAEDYLREDVLHATPLEQAGGLTTEQRRLVAENHVHALEGKQRREKEEAERAAATHAAATAAAEGEWQRRNTEALDARRAADARVRATADNVPISWTTEYRDANAKDAARAAAARLKALAQDAERAAQEENALRARETAMRIDQARATLARRKIELGEQDRITAAERDALDRAERDASEAHTAAQHHAAQQAARDEAARAARARAAATADKLRVAREAIGDSLLALAGGDERARRSAQKADGAAREEADYANVDYWDTLTSEQRVAILASPTLRLCVRHRDMEQTAARRMTDVGVEISMEPKERRNISTPETKHVANAGLAIERAYGIQYAYAVDGSKDEVEAWGEGATGERAAAWGAWDGITAYGGALPPGTGNQEAELYAIERILARHGRGDRLLIMCDCQAALTTVDGTWQSGRVGTGSPAAGRTGGLLVEAITRHRLRISSRTDDTQPRGCVCFLWVKAHGGGVVPNVYADAIAKSCLTAEVDYATVNAPYTTLPRACLYATQPTPRDDTWELDSAKYSCIAADRSLRRIIIEGMTRHVLARLPRRSRAHCDVRVLGDVMHMQGRPAGATPGATARRSVTAPTETGGALRLRSDDLRQRDTACPLCLTPGPLEGSHVMRCTAIPPAHRDAAMAKVYASLDAAANALPSGAWCSPSENTLQAWKDAASRIGQHGAAAALGPAPADQHSHPPTTASAWASRGWKRKADRHALDMSEGAAGVDKRLAAWCAVAIRSAHRAALRAAEAEGATAEVASACAEAVRKLEEGPLGTADRAVGQATVDDDTGAPDGDGFVYQNPNEGGIEAIRISFAQLQPHTQGAHVREWEGQRSWLQMARAQADERTWTAHVHRGFRSEGGAAGRKVEHSVAVDPLGAVYTIAAPARWPWLVEYEIDGRDAARQDGTDGQRVRISIQLGLAEGALKARVCARHVRADGLRHRGDDTAITAEVELAGDTRGMGLRAMFWDIAFGAHVEVPGAQAAVRRAAAVAAQRGLGDPGGAQWHILRCVLGGEIPPPTPRERTEAHRAKRTASDDAAADAETRVRDKYGEAPVKRAKTQVSDAAECLGAAAGVLGVPVDADFQLIRRAYLRAAVRTHPDKGGSGDAFNGLQEAYQRLEGATSDARQGAAQELRDANTAAAQARRDAVDTAAQRALRLESEVRKARAEASQRAEKAWIPPWRDAARHLRKASGAFMDLWTEYQRRVTRSLNEYARSVEGGGYETHGARMAAAAVTRKAARRHEREAMKRRAVEHMRHAEQRAAHARRQAALAAAERLRQRSAEAIMEAARLDSTVLMEEFRVRAPYAAWKGHKDSALDRYELYDITEIDAHWVTLVRSAASAAERRAPIAQAGWNRFQIPWDCFTGATRFGPDHRGFEIVPRGAAPATSEDDTEESEDEHRLEAQEERRAVRAATQLLRAARTAARGAARVLRDAARQDGGDTAADDALRHEGADDANGPEAGTSDSDPPDDAHADPYGGGAETPPARRRGTWNGRNWAREAWTGPVAAAEYAEAWTGGAPPCLPGSAAANAARRAAQRASLEANELGHARAVEIAAQETSRRTRRLWAATEDAAATREQQSATDFLAEFVRQWQEREPPDTQPLDTTGATQAAAAAAADALQRRHPAKDTVAAAARKRVMVDAARLFATSGVSRDSTGDTAATRARKLLRRNDGRSSQTPEDVIQIVTTVLEHLPSTRGPTGAPLHPAPGVHRVSAQHTVADDSAVPTTPDTTRDAAEHVEREPPPFITIRVGNLRAECTEGRRPEGAEDRRVDRGTPLGNPFPIDTTDDGARESACAAYAALIQGDPGSLNVQEIAAPRGLRVDRRYTSRGAIRAMHHALRQLEQIVTALRPGKSIRLMCHCAPKRCHAHVLAHEIQRRLQTRGIHILVEDGGWGRAETYEDNGRGDDDVSIHDEDRGNADSTCGARADTGGRASATQDPAVPRGAHTDAADGQPELFPRLLARLKGHRDNRLRNESAITGFFREFPGPGALTQTHPHSPPAATRPREMRGPNEAVGDKRGNGGGADAARAAGAVGMRSARLRKSPKAMARVRAAVAKAAAERAARAARTTADAATGIATTAAATGAAATAAEAAKTEGTTVTGAGKTAAEATVTREATAGKMPAKEETMAAADGWVRLHDTLGPDDSHESGTTQAKRQQHVDDDDARGGAGGTEETKAARHATANSGVTGGTRKRWSRSGSEGAKAKKRKPNKYGE